MAESSAAPATRLDALTSLRFVAAMMIVAFHTQDAFGNSRSAYSLAQGVSFFYVLSGFILTLVYPRLDGWAATRRFWRARVARVWPAYFVAFLVGIGLVAYSWHATTLAAYLGMVQAWIPIPAYYFGYNAPGWSVSTEAFFYLAFPLLLHNLERTWHWKLAGTLALVVVLAVIAQSMGWPTSVRGWVGAESFQPDQNGLMYTNPLARIFEFTCGMCIALAWRRRGPGPASPWLSTALEIAAVALCVLSLRVVPLARGWVDIHLGTAMGLWYWASGSVVAFAALVYVMALGRGALSRALSWRPFVVLGEISFSIYLLHQLLLNGYLARAQDLPQLPGRTTFAIYLGVLMLSSYVMWRFIEMPARRVIVGNALHGSSVVTQAPVPRLRARLLPALAVLVLLVAVVGIRWTLKPAGEVVLGTLTPAQRLAPRAQGSCSIEAVDGIAFAPGAPMQVEGRTVRLTGWFLSQMSRTPGVPAALRVTVEGGEAGWIAPITNWTARPDVTEAMQATGPGDTGFAQRLDLSGLAAGTYRVAVLWEEAGAWYSCDPNRLLQIDG
jgi:peptidoglycan/LPS O-acetylase OafA/YrhL